MVKGEYMLKLEIKMDEEKIREEKKYRVESIYQALGQAFSRYELNQLRGADGTMCFTGNGNPKDYGAFGSIITSLREKAWFMDYVTKWMWYNSDDGENEDDYVVPAGVDADLTEIEFALQVTPKLKNVETTDDFMALFSFNDKSVHKYIAKND